MHASYRARRSSTKHLLFSQDNLTNMSLPRPIDPNRRRSSIAKITRPPWTGASPIHSPSPRKSNLSSLYQAYNASFKQDTQSTSSKVFDESGSGSSLENEPFLDSAGMPQDPRLIELFQRHLRSENDASPFAVEGADVTRDIYRISDRPSAKRSKSLSLMESSSLRRESFASSLNVPGGFRREFISSHSNKVQPNFLTRNFVEFLSVYGHFAGESLEDDQDIACHYSAYNPVIQIGEETPLKGTYDRVNTAGTATDSKAYFLLVKAFVGTGVLFLPKAFSSGGLLFSALMLFLFGLLSYWCYVVLVYSKIAVRVSSFTEIGRILYGSWFQQLILFSILLSQIGFVATYIIFTAENLRAFIVNVTSYSTSDIDIVWLIALQTCILTPLSFIRDITKLSLLALLANVFIMIGLVTIICFTGGELILNGLEPGSGVYYFFNKSEFSLFIGVAIFAFEGIGLIIPIQESMIYPNHFPKVLAAVIITISTIFVFIGALGYFTFGEKIETVILLNLPQTSPFVIMIQILYALAILLSTPIQIFPAVRLIELRIFSIRHTGRSSATIKWLKNLIRLSFVLLTSFAALYGGQNLDKFVSFVGCFACIPLVYMYPPMLHFKSCCDDKSNSTDRQSKYIMALVDYAMIVLGGIALVYTTYDLLTS